jgi:predicted transcriptional regulator with HTH domain
MTLIQIHKAFVKAEIAFRYYQEKYPSRNYSKEQARKQFSQDSNIDQALLKKVIDQVYQEQMREL